MRNITDEDMDYRKKYLTNIISFLKDGWDETMTIEELQKILQRALDSIEKEKKV